jgi:hypothetical protein
MLRILLLAAVVFLPVFQVATVAELKLRGVAFSEPLSYHVSGAVVAYLGLLLPVLLGAIVYGATVLLIPSRATARAGKVALVALAPLLPLTAIMSGLAPIVTDYLGSAAMATLAYGLVCASRLGSGTTAEEGDEVPRKTAM